MKKYSWKILLALVAIVIISVISSYNSLVNLSESRSAGWGNVQNSYQRRADLIPNLVNVVKGYAKHEQSTLTQVIQARANATSVTIKVEDLNAESMQKFQSAQDGLSSALSRLLAIAESYPDLKANQNFLNLQEQLEGTENRIAYVREQFNDLTNKYNKKRNRVPTVFWVKMFYPKFKAEPYFESKEGSENAPIVEF